MKKVITASIIATTLFANAHAEAKSAKTEAKQAALFSTGAIAGAVIGGPVGMFVGSLGGVWMAEKVEQADTLSDQLDETQAMLVETQASLANKEQQLLAASMVAQLKLDLMFTTGSSQLEAQNNEVVAQLASFLSAHRDLIVRIDGHADPRGDKNENLELSKARSTAVRDQLIMLGVEPVRIQTFAHGETFADVTNSSANTGYSSDGYALDRRVSIQIAPAEQNFAIR